MTTNTTTYSSNDLSLYIDGTLNEGGLFTQGNAPYKSPGSSRALGLGAREAGSSGSSFFPGSIDEVAIWSTALSATDVALIYSRQSAKYAATYTSRIVDALDSQSWTGLNWKTTLPYGKALPDAVTASPSPSPSNESKLSGYASLTSSTLMNDIVGLWHLDDSSTTTALDTSGYGNNGTKTNITAVNGKIGSAAYFNATNSTITTSIASSFYEATSAQPLTISFWMNPATIPAAQLGGQIISLRSNSGTNDLAIGVGSNSSITYYAASTYSNWTAVANSNQWSHIALVYTGTCFQRYINGVADGSCTNSALAAAGSFSLEMGSGYTGALDEVAIWSRNLSAGEIMELYRRGSNRIKFQVQSCSNSSCTSGSGWVGPDGTNQTYFSELYNTSNGTLTGSVLDTLPSLSLPGAVVANEWFQYRTIFESDDSGNACTYDTASAWCSPELQSVSITPTHYDYSSPAVSSNSGVPYKGLASFSEINGSGCTAGTVYNISNNGVNWYYWNTAATPAAWTLAGTTANTASSASVINAHITSFASAVGSGSLRFKAFLQSSGSTSCQLGSVTATGSF